MIVHSYGYFGSWNKGTAHFAPKTETLKSMELWDSKKISKKKILMTIPFSGLELQLKSEYHGDRNKAWDQDIVKNIWGRMPYNQICQHIKNDLWQTNDGPEPYTYHGKRWISFHNTTFAALY